MKRHALRCVLSDKVRNDRLVCLDSMDGIDGRTRSMIGMLERLNISGSAVVVTRDSDQNVVRAAGNLKRIYTIPVNQLNAEILLGKDTLVLTVEAARWAEEALASEPHGRRGRKFSPSSTREGIDAEVEPVSVLNESEFSETVSEATSDTGAEEDGE